MQPLQVNYDLSGWYASLPKKGSCYWCLDVDDFTRKCWSLLMANKDEIATKLEYLIVKLNVSGHTIQKVHCDNSGENKAWLATTLV